MTQQEALKELENLTIDYGKRTAEEIERLDEAVDMAIAALRADALERQPCDDAVSRQQAIDALKGLPTWWADEGGYYGGAQPPMVALLDPEDAVSAIENLPSAQSHDIARGIATIIENEKDMRVILKNAQPDAPDTNGGDIIYRKAAIDALESIGSLDTEADKKYARSVFEALPSAQPEQRWIPWSSGKLPEESGTYTVTAYDGVTKRATYAKYQKRLKRWELTGARAYWRVLAWMPLPEPYKEGHDERE